MEILVCGMTENQGGIEIYLANLVSRFNPDKIKLSFVKEKEEIAFKELLQERNCKIYEIPWRRKNPIKHISKLKRLLKEKKDIDLLYVNAMSSVALPSVIAGRLAGKKVLVHSRNNYTKCMPLHNLLKPILNACTDYCFACSTLAGRYMFGSRKFEVISNGINFEKFKYDESVRKEIREKYNLDESQFVLGFVGNLTYQKNVIYLIDIFAALSEKHDNVRLMLVGDGELRNEVEASINKYNIKDKVLLLGKQSNTAVFYQAFDLFLFPSRYEGFGNVLIEAQIAGLPCVCTRGVIPDSTRISKRITYVSNKETIDTWIKEIEKYMISERREFEGTGEEKKYELSNAIAHIEDLLLMINQNS